MIITDLLVRRQLQLHEARARDAVRAHWEVYRSRPMRELDVGSVETARGQRVADESGRAPVDLGPAVVTRLAGERRER